MQTGDRDVVLDYLDNQINMIENDFTDVLTDPTIYKPGWEDVFMKLLNLYIMHYGDEYYLSADLFDMAMNERNFELARRISKLIPKDTRDEIIIYRLGDILKTTPLEKRREVLLSILNKLDLNENDLTYVIE